MKEMKLLQYKENEFTLYHGTIDKFCKPIIMKNNKKKDFGSGFYLTKSREQAISFAKRRMLTFDSSLGWVHSYSIRNFDELKILYFEQADEDWFKFILDCRKNPLHSSNYDIIIGKIADDGTRAVLDFYDFEMSVINGRSENDIIHDAITKLLPNRLQEQFCFCSDKAIDRLEFMESMQV